MILWRLAADESAATSSEYALLLAIVGTGIALAAFALGGTVSCAINRAATVVESSTPSSPNYGTSGPSTAC